MTDVFISYATEDRARVAPLVATIERRGWSVWWDRNIGAGAPFDRAIEKAIDDARCIVVVWSVASVESDWVRNEATEGLDRGVLIPVAIDSVRLPLAFRRTQTIDLAAHSGAVDELIEAIGRLCPVRGSTPANSIPLVGREAELVRLQSYVQRALGGDGALVVLSGEAGVGKTRLVEAIGSRARDAGMLVLTGSCHEDAGAPPYQPLIEQFDQAARIVSPESFRAVLGDNAAEMAKLMPELRQLFSDLPDPVNLPRDQERRYLLRGCGEIIDRASRIQPVMLVFEDLQWAGESTCHLLTHLVGRLRNSAVLLMGTYRDTDLGLSQPFSIALHDLLRGRLVEDIRLQRLTRSDVAALLEQRAGRKPSPDVVSVIYEESEGNPLFVDELYRYLRESHKLFRDDGEFVPTISMTGKDVPRGIRLVIEHRLAKVNERCRQLLISAAVKGKVVDFAVLGRISELSGEALIDALEEAISAALLEDVSLGREARYQFVHEQIRQTLLGSLSLPRRQMLHLKIADTLEQGSSDVVARNTAEIAFHLYEAGSAADKGRTAHYLLNASERAIDAAAFEDAMALLDMAMEVVPDDDQRQRVKLYAMRGYALRGAARIDDALASLAEGIASCAGVDSARDLLRQRAALYVDLYRADEALPDLEQLLAASRSSLDHAFELSVQRLLADAHYRLSLDRPDHAVAAREACERTIELARAQNDERALVRSLILSINFVDYWVDYRRKAIRNLEEAKAIASSLREEDLLLDCAAKELRISIVTPLEHEVRAEEILKRLEVRRDPIRISEHIFCMIHPAREAGHLERSVELCDRGIEIAEQLNVPPVQLPSLKAMALIALGRLTEAWRSIEEEVADPGHRFGSAFQWYTYFYFKAQMGAIEQVMSETEPLVAECRALNRIWMIEHIVEIVAIAAARHGRHDEAIAVLRRVAGDVTISDRAQAELSLARGDFEDALRRAGSLEEAQEARGMRLLSAELGELKTRCLLGLKRWEEALREADAHMKFCREVGYRMLLWRLLACRAEACCALLRTAESERDYGAVAALVDTLLNDAPTEELRRAFRSEPIVATVLRRSER